MIKAKFKYSKKLDGNVLQEEEILGIFDSIILRTKYVNENVQISDIYFIVAGQEYLLRNTTDFELRGKDGNYIKISNEGGKMVVKGDKTYIADATFTDIENWINQTLE